MSESIFNDVVDLSDIPKSEWRKSYIGKGYRYACYMTNHEHIGHIMFFGYDLEGNPKTFKCPHKSWIKYNVKYDTDEQDVYGRYVMTKTFNSSSLRRKYLESCEGINIVECFRPESEFLHEMFDDCVLDDDFNTQPMRIHYLDIETEISDQFMPPSQADNRVNMITIYDSKTEKYYTWSLEHAEIDFKEDPLKDYPKDKFVFYEFHNDESALLEHFISWYQSNIPDVIYGWNIKGYDIPYMYTRLRKLFGKTTADMLSPVGKCFVKDVNHDNARADVAAEIEVVIDGVFQADGLLLYRDKFKIAGSSLDGGYSLDNVGEIEGCGNKIHYSGTLKDLYIKDYQKFYEYNVRDVDLCKRIDDKCKMISLARKVASYGLCNYDTIYSSIAYLIGSVAQFAKIKMNGKILTSYLKEKHDYSGFEGAFVFPCTPNVYRGGIGCIDFASLYPSNIRSINASPETYIGKIQIYFKDRTGQIYVDKIHEKRFDPFGTGPTTAEDEFINSDDPNIDHLEIQLPGDSGKSKPISIESLREIIKTKCIWTANNTLFLKHGVKWGCVAKWCEYFYGLRKSTKKKEMKIFHLLHNQEEVSKLSQDEVYKLTVDMENYHSAQMALKIMINSIYGCTGTGFSPIADPNIAQSITRQGRFANKSTAKFVKKRFMEKYGAGPDYKEAASGDTDSIFLNLQCVTDWYKKQYGLPEKIHNWKQSDRNKLWKEMSTFVDGEINEFVRNLIHDFCHTDEQNVLTYELEYMSDVGIYEGMKHYATHKIFDEGDPVDKIKYSGIELKKGSVPKEMKTFLQEIYEGVILHDWKESDYKNYVDDLYNRFKNFSVDEISFWKGYNTERETAGFLKMAQSVNPVTGKTIGTTGIAKACAFYNQIIEKLGLGKKYDQLRLGDKARFLYIKDNNNYRINCMAYKNGQWPQEFNQIFEPDYKKMFEKVILDPLKRFREACRFKSTDPTKQLQFDIFQL